MSDMSRASFRLTSAAVSWYPPGSTFGPRKMRDWEFVWIIEGDCRYRRDATWVAAPPGSVVVCVPGTIDEFQWDAKRQTRHGYFHFNRLPAGLKMAAETIPLVRRPSESDVLRGLFRHVLAWFGRGDAQLAESVVKTMLIAFASGEHDVLQPPPVVLPECVERTLARVQQAIAEQPDEPLTFEELVEASGVTGPYLCRVFKKHVGHAPLETATLLRLHEASAMFERTNLTVQQVAQRLGFKTPFHLSRLYTKAYGMSPTAHRRHMAEGGVPRLSPLHWKASFERSITDMFFPSRSMAERG